MTDFKCPNGITDYYVADLAIFAISLIGKKGCIKFNTCMVEHNDDLELSKKEYRALKKEETITIGQKDKTITKKQVEEFLQKLQEYVRRSEFYDNGRTYFFEGIEQLNDKEYRISWGS